MMKSPASPWSFKIAWEPPVRANGCSKIRYDVKFSSKEADKWHTFRTVDDEPDIELPDRVIREKIGEIFTVQIRILNSHGRGEWSEASRVFSVAKCSRYQVQMAPRPTQLV